MLGLWYTTFKEIYFLKHKTIEHNYIQYIFLEFISFYFLTGRIILVQNFNVGWNRFTFPTFDEKSISYTPCVNDVKSNGIIFATRWLPCKMTNTFILLQTTKLVTCDKHMEKGRYLVADKISWSVCMACKPINLRVLLDWYGCI